MRLDIPEIKFEYFDVIDSTNTEAKRRFDSLPPGCRRSLHKTLIAAGEQTAGRGRLGRKFYSPADTGIYFSLIYAEGTVSEPGLITAAAAVAVSRAIERVFNVRAEIKWVNDVFVNGKKVCGILTEGIMNSAEGSIEAVVIGIGINVYSGREMPSELLQKAGGICGGFENKTDGGIAEKNLHSQKSLLLKNCVEELLKILDGTSSEITPAMIEYRERSNLIGKTVSVSPVIGTQDKNYICIVKDITSDAKLVVVTQSGETKILESGEVTLHNICDNVPVMI